MGKISLKICKFAPIFGRKKASKTAFLINPALHTYPPKLKKGKNKKKAN